MYNMNKRSWKLLVGLLFITLLVYLFQSTTFSIKDLSTNTFTKHDETILSSDNELDIVQDANERMAYVTFLCDDIMGEATEVLVYSLKQTQTKHDIVVLVLDDVTQTVRNRLEYLGAQIINVDQVKYPWDSSSARRKGFNKACRYSKLNLWNLTQYKKVVFLDADTMVVNPIDDLFEYPQFTAAVDIGGVLNTGVFVAEPNTDTYNDIMKTYENAPSYNRGDQGFLNYYFNQSANILPGNYNLMIKFTHFSTLASSFVAKNTAKVLHFTSETKPWNFHFLHQREWRENYDGHLFGVWTRALRQTRNELSAGGLYDSSSSDMWENKGRVAEVCDNRIKKNYGRRYPKSTQFTVILNLSKSISVNLNQLANVLRTYSSSKKVAQIYTNSKVVKDEEGNKINLDTFLRKLHLRKPIKTISRGAFKSANNRFNPIQGIMTTSVFLTDENVITSLDELEFGFEVWKKNQDAIVGFRSDSHGVSTSDDKVTFTQNFDGEYRYSMIKSNSMFLRSDYLHAYTCLIPEEIHQYIDKHPSCYDIAMNMLVSGMTGSSPVLVDTAYSQWTKQSNIIQQQKSQCLNELPQFFNNNNPLIFNNELVTQVSSKVFNEEQ